MYDFFNYKGNFQDTFEWISIQEESIIKIDCRRTFIKELVSQLLTGRDRLNSVAFKKNAKFELIRYWIYIKPIRRCSTELPSKRIPGNILRLVTLTTRPPCRINVSKLLLPSTCTEDEESPESG